MKVSALLRITNLDPFCGVYRLFPCRSHVHESKIVELFPLPGISDQRARVREFLITAKCPNLI